MIQELRWTHCTLPEHVKGNITPQELEFFKRYSRNLGSYMRSRDLDGIGLDLTAVSEPYLFFFFATALFYYIIPLFYYIVRLLRITVV